jgi:hypothetical protein
VDEDEVGLRGTLAVKTPRNALNVLFLLLGVLLLLALAATPFLPWISITRESEQKDKTTHEKTTVTGMGLITISGVQPFTSRLSDISDTLGAPARPEGLVLHYAALTCGLVLLLGFVLAWTGLLGLRASRFVAASLAMVGEAASIVFLCWGLAWIWKAVALSDSIREFTDRSQALHAQDAVVGRFDATVTTSTYPGLGLFVGIGLSMVAAYMFSMLSSRLIGRGWGYLADVTGLVLGGVVLALVVAPWNTQAILEGLQLFLG